MDHPRNDDDEEYALYATSAVDRDAAAALFALLHEIEIDAPVAIERIACTPTGEVHLTYQRDGGPPVGDEAGHLCGAYIRACGEADGFLGVLEVTVLGSDGEPRAHWRLVPDWTEAFQADRIDNDELMDRVSTTVEVV